MWGKRYEKKWLSIGGGIVVLIILFVILQSCSDRSRNQTPTIPVSSFGQYIDLGNPEPVTIKGYSGPQEDPVMSPDGEYLFFDSFNDGRLPQHLYYAKHIDYKTFQFLGEVRGANAEGKTTLRGNYDLVHNFYFVSQLCATSSGVTGICRGTFTDGTVTSVVSVKGLPAPEPPPGSFGAVFDVAISPDGKTLYYTNAILDTSRGVALPSSSHIFVAKKNSDGSFTTLPESDQIMRNVNNTTSTVYNAAPSPDELTFVFTAPNLPDTAQLYAATRTSASVPFGVPAPMTAANTPTGKPYPNPESGSFSPDGAYLYFHRSLSQASSQIYVLTRQK